MGCGRRGVIVLSPVASRARLLPYHPSVLIVPPSVDGKLADGRQVGDGCKDFKNKVHGLSSFQQERHPHTDFAGYLMIPAKPCRMTPRAEMPVRWSCRHLDAIYLQKRSASWSDSRKVPPRFPSVRDCGDASDPERVPNGCLSVRGAPPADRDPARIGRGRRDTTSWSRPKVAPFTESNPEQLVDLSSRHDPGVINLRCRSSARPVFRPLAPAHRIVYAREKTHWC